MREARQDFINFEYMKRFPPTKFKKMLCIGAGTGAEVLAANELGYEAVGIGVLNNKQLAYAVNRGVDMLSMDMHDIRLPVESFDVLYSRDSLEHSVAPWIACMEAWAMLRPLGRWWITMGPYKGAAMDSRGPTNDHFSVLPGWIWDSIFRRSGFHILEKMDDEIYFQYLLMKQPLSEIDPEPENNQNLSIVDQLEARLRM